APHRPLARAQRRRAAVGLSRETVRAQLADDDSPPARARASAARRGAPARPQQLLPPRSRARAARARRLDRKARTAAAPPDLALDRTQDDQRAQAHNPERQCTMTDIPKIFRVTLEVANLDQASAFYAKLLGTEGKRHPGARDYFDCGGVILAVLDVTQGGLT